MLEAVEDAGVFLVRNNLNVELFCFVFFGGFEKCFFFYILFIFFLVCVFLCVLSYFFFYVCFLFRTYCS